MIKCDNLNELPNELLVYIAGFCGVDIAPIFKLVDKRLYTIGQELFKQYNSKLGAMDFQLKRLFDTEKDSKGNLLKDTEPHKLFRCLIEKRTGKNEISLKWACENYHSLTLEATVIEKALKLPVINLVDTSDGRNWVDTFLHYTISEFKKSQLSAVFVDLNCGIHILSAAMQKWNKEFGFNPGNIHDPLATPYEPLVTEKKKQEFIKMFRKNFVDYMLNYIVTQVDGKGCIINLKAYELRLLQILKNENLSENEINEKIKQLLPLTPERNFTITREAILLLLNDINPNLKKFEDPSCLLYG